MRTEAVELRKPVDANIIVGQSHFIKTVEDIYEALVNSVPGIKFGIAFCEASADRLIRVEGNDDDAAAAAVDNALRIAAGHTFVVVLSQRLSHQRARGPSRTVPEVCGIFCATANDAEVLVAETEKGRGIIGVVDGQTPTGSGE